jgi:hypothetical protein
VYGAFLGANRGAFDEGTTSYVRSTTNPATTPFTPGSSISTLGNGANPILDQPWVQAARVGGQDRVYVAYNDLGAPTANTAYVAVSNTGAAGFQAAVPIATNTVGQDNPAVRVAVQGNEVYAVYERRTAAPGPTTVPGQIMVVRDDAGGIKNAGNPNPFQALGAGGVAADAGTLARPSLLLGQQRLGSDLSIATDPSDRTGMTVYLAYDKVIRDPDGVLDPRLFVEKSTMGGAAGSWSSFFPGNGSIGNAGLPAIAVAADGTVGLLYTRLLNGNMDTKFLELTSTGVTKESVDLAIWPQNTPVRVGSVYIGDYQQLLTVGNSFFGTFSASNDPSLANWANPALNVIFQRQVLGTLGTPGATLGNGMGGAGPAISIDPYFFTTVPEPAALAMALIAVGIVLTWSVVRGQPRAKATFLPRSRSGLTS